MFRQEHLKLYTRFHNKQPSSRPGELFYDQTKPKNYDQGLVQSYGSSRKTTVSSKFAEKDGNFGWIAEEK